MDQLRCANRTLTLDRAHVMGILNVTPDSFSDGGSYHENGRLIANQALVRAAEMVDEGATLIDVGGESTRPGAEPVSVEEELDRVLPVVELIAKELDVVISLDTSTPSVITEAAKLGAGLVNDVRALSREGALQAAANTDMAVCLMHMKGAPLTMQDHPVYGNVFDEVSTYLQERVHLCVSAGISLDRICLDPGFGFGKTLEHNLQLMKHLDNIQIDNLPLLIGTSRKTMIGQTLNKTVDQRLFGSLATVSVGVMKGAKIIRVHDVAQTVDVVKMTEAIMYVED
jgi:dihydropteroate synthase